MRGLETAFWGTLGKDPELRTSKTGNPFTTMNVAVTVGRADDGKDVTQWVRVACFGETAERIASKAKKGDRLYCEGQLTLNQWNDTQGEVRHGLSLAAWKTERVAAIGKSREKRPGHDDSNGPGAVQHKRQPERSRHDFNDEMPF